MHLNQKGNDDWECSHYDANGKSAVTQCDVIQAQILKIYIGKAMKENLMFSVVCVCEENFFPLMLLL